MARKSATFIADTKGAQLIPLDEIPQDVKDLVNEMLEAQSKGSGRTRLEYDTEDELATEFRQMVSYAGQRPEGILKIRKRSRRCQPR